MGNLCGHFKMVNIFIVQQDGYIKYPCLACLRDKRKECLLRENLKVGERNVINTTLVECEKIILPLLLHIKMGTVGEHY